MPKIILTGGGTAGHVTPNIALLPGLKEAGFEILYIGSYEGIEKRLIEREGIEYRGISTGKLRRYFDVKNFTDPFRVLMGFREASKIIKEFQPDVVFSKGGYVSVPVVRAAGMRHIPVVIHESDMTPGLANKLSYGAAKTICCNFPETVQYLPADKALVTGSPIRAELLSGSKERGYELTGVAKDRPVLMVIGGSLGSRAVNEAVRAALPELLKEFSVVHLCGKGNVDESLNDVENYHQYEYVSDDLKDLFALADIMISRAGANSICEILELKKPNVLIPLSAAASRGDQILNAMSFEKQGYSCLLEEEDMTPETLIEAVNETWAKRDEYIAAMEQSPAGNAVSTILDLLIRTAAGEAEEDAGTAGEAEEDAETAGTNGREIVHHRHPQPAEDHGPRDHPGPEGSGPGPDGRSAPGGRSLCPVQRRLDPEDAAETGNAGSRGACRRTAQHGRDTGSGFPGPGMVSRTGRFLCAPGGRLLRTDHGPEPEDPLGQLFRRRESEFQLSSHARPGGSTGLRHCPRALPPAGNEPLRPLLAGGRPGPPGLEGAEKVAD